MPVSETYEKFPPDWFPDDVELIVAPRCRWCGEDAWFIVKSVPMCPKGLCMQATKNLFDLGDSEEEA